MLLHWYNRIAVRLSVSIVAVVVVTALSVATLILHDEKHVLQEDLRIRALQLGEILPQQLLEPLLYDEYYALYSLIQSYLESKERFLIYGEIYNDQGELILAREREPVERKPIASFDLAREQAVFLRDFTDASKEHPLDLLIPISSKQLGVAGYLRLGISVQPLFKTLQTSRQKVWALTGVIVIIGILAALWMARQLISPIPLLNRAAHRVGEGDFGVAIPEKGVGEIGELATTFNTMSHQLKELVTAIRSAQENLVRTEKLYALGEFSAGLAHEIKNPLTSIKMLIQRAGEQGEPLQGEDLEVIVEEIDRIDYTVSRFLRSARQSEMAFSETDINRLVEDVLAITRPKIEKSGVHIEKTLDAHLDPLQVDGHSIKQVLMNGILNALQAMPSGGKLSISTSLIDNALQCTITDTGDGISEANLKHIFDPFFTTKEDGTGMGLAVAWNIAQQHGGRLDIVSREHEGTSLILILPYDNSAHC
jgi:signal transduction histidine kinase